ncbi:MAG TPA: hypothetical protein VG496_02950, partial [Myxococcales bacterium]|nr:hypothetical protein [Myxococcales bacterium]
MKHCPLRHAAVIDTVSCGGAVVVTVKLAVVWPAGTVTFAGQLAIGALVQLRVTTAPPLGAGRLSVTVPVVLFPPTTGLGLKVRLLGIGAGVPHTLETPEPPHTWGELQVPQAIQLPQPSRIAPQFLPCAAQLVGVQPPPHTLLLPPPPQVAGEAQDPQLRVPPQPSGIDPQFLPSAAQVTFAQVGVWTTARNAA